MPGTKEEFADVVKRIVQLALILMILMVVNAVATRLPGMETTVFSPPYDLSIANITSLVIYIITIAVILIFGQNIALRLPRLVPSFPEIASLVFNAVILLAIIIGYHVFDVVLTPLLDDLGLPWLYPLIFLVLSLLPVWKIASVLLTSSGKITNLFVGNTTPTQKVVCASCGGQVSPSKFCSQCGNELVQAADSGGNVCPQCGAALKPGAKFCIKCGTKVAD
ncbi:MAG: zinc ribbon domain-containing protein [Bacillota bacterium]